MKLKKRKNRRLRVTISRMRRHAPFEPIDPNSCVSGGVPDIINSAIFFENRSRGLGAGIPRKTAFPIESVHRPYKCQHYRAALWLLYGTHERNANSVWLKWHICVIFSSRNIEQERCAVARKLRDAAAVLFGLKFADNIHYKFNSSQASKARLQSFKHTGTKQNLTQSGHPRSRILESVERHTSWHCNDMIGNLHVTIWYAASKVTQKIFAVLVV